MRLATAMMTTAVMDEGDAERTCPTRTIQAVHMKKA
jgi:hypothetical protein